MTAPAPEPQAPQPAGPSWGACLAALLGEPVCLPRHRGRRRRHILATDADRDPRACRPVKAKRLQTACCSRSTTP